MMIGLDTIECPFTIYGSVELSAVIKVWYSCLGNQAADNLTEP